MNCSPARRRRALSFKSGPESVIAFTQWEEGEFRPLMTESMHNDFAVAIVAAGRGERAGQSSEGPKQFRLIGGEPVLALTVKAFSSHPLIGPIAIAIHRDDMALFTGAMGELASRVVPVEGGYSRQESVLRALRRLGEFDPEFVMIHDGVRPFIEKELIDRLGAAVERSSGALPGIPVSDTLKRVDADGYVIATEPRDGLNSAQTPQVFPFAPILEAHERAAIENPHGFTDDAALAEWANIPTRIIDGSAENVKLTWAKDIERANRTLARHRGVPDIRTGTGYDVHGFTVGDHVMLCGVRIPYERKLRGHSDADVGLHALTDALLATCGAGDIGTHFPPSDPKWNGVASEVFLRHAAGLIERKDGLILNADVTIVAEAPRIDPHRTEMAGAIRAVLGIEPDRISIKATTNERLGFVGRGEGIAAIATATVCYGNVP